MSLLAIGLGALSVGVVGGLGYWMVQANNKMIRLLDMQTLLRESQATHFHHLNIATEGVLSDLNTLQTTLDALRATHPDIDASMAVHQFLLAYETESSPAIDIQRACEVLRSVVQHQPIEGGVSDHLSVNHASLLRRLLTVFEHHQLTVSALHMDGDTAHRLGLAACYLQRYDWAEGALGVAYQSRWACKRARGFGTHRPSGDDALYRHWLEARMKLTDDPDLLRPHAHLLASMGDEEAEHAVRRLEALGVDTAADRPFSPVASTCWSKNRNSHSASLGRGPEPVGRLAPLRQLLRTKASEDCRRPTNVVDLDRQNGEACLQSPSSPITRPRPRGSESRHTPWPLMPVVWTPSS